LALLPAIALWVAGCGAPPEKSGGETPASASAKSARSANTIVYVDKRDPRTLDPALFEDAYDNVIAAMMHQGLVRFGEGTDVVPALAESWEIAEDGLSITFKLREATFHNGSTVDAHDVKYSITRILDAKVGSQRKWMFQPYLIGWNDVPEGASEAYAQWVTSGEPGGAEADPGVQGVKVIDDLTVAFHSDRPYLPLLTMLAMANAGIVPLGSMAKNDRLVPGAGPWQVVSWQQGEQVRLRRFEKYWEGPAATENLVFRAIEDHSTWRAEFDAGNVDFYTVSEADYRSWRNDPAKQKLMVKMPELNVYYLAMGMDKPPLNDIRVRQAVAHAINSAELYEFILLGKGDPSSGPVPPGIEGYTADLPRFGFDREKAKALLKEAGAEGATIRLYHPTDDLASQVCLNARANLQEIGLQVQVRQLDRTAFRESVKNNEPDMFFSNWWADYPDIENFVDPLFHSSHIPGSNWTRFNDPDLDALITKARFTADPAERIALFEQATRKIVEAVPAAWLWHRCSYVAVNPRIRGFKTHPMLSGIDYHDVSIVSE